MFETLDQLTEVGVGGANSSARPNARRGAGLGLAASVALLALSSCTVSPPTFPGKTIQVVQLAAFVHQRILVDGAKAEEAAPAQPTQPPAAAAVVAPASSGGVALARASLALEGGQYRAALAMFQKLLRRQPSNVDALFGAALAAHELKASKEASAYLTQTLALQPNHPRANVLAGFDAQLERRYDGAREHYTRFLSVEDKGEGADEIRAVLANLPPPAAAP